LTTRHGVFNAHAPCVNTLDQSGRYLKFLLELQDKLIDLSETRKPLVKTSTAIGLKSAFGVAYDQGALTYAAGHARGAI